MAGKLGELEKKVSAAVMGGMPVLVLKEVAKAQDGEVEDGTATAAGG